MIILNLDFKLRIIYILLFLSIFIPIIILITKSYDIFTLKKFDTIIFLSFLTFAVSFILLIFTLYFFISNNIQLSILFLIFFIIQVCIYTVITKIVAFMVAK